MFFSTQRTGRRRARAGLTGLAVLVGGLLGAAAPAGAQTAQWSCAGSALRLSGPGLTTVEPILAARAPCDRWKVEVTRAGALAPGVQAATADAVTDATPVGARPIAQTVDAAASLGGGSIAAQGGKVVVGIAKAISSAKALCVAGNLTTYGASSVEGLTVNGQALASDGVLSGLRDAQTGAPLDESASVKLNEQVRTPDGVVQRAVHITLLRGTTTVADLVLAESSTISTDACKANVPPNSSGGTTGSSVSRNGVNGGCGRLTVFFSPSHARSLSAQYGRRHLIRGRLVSCTGKPISRARVDVYHLVGGKKVKYLRSGLTTSPTGRMSLTLPRTMTTRTFVFEYRGFLNSSRVTSRRALRLVVRNSKGEIVHRAG